MVDDACGTMGVIAIVGTLLGLIVGHLLTMWLVKRVRRGLW